MRRLAVLAAMAALLAGCSAEPVGVSNVDASKWETVTDDLTGRSFRCLFVWRSTGYAGGLTTVCYEPAVQS